MQGGQRNLASPRISIVVATFNAANTLSRCLDSIAAQSYEACEVVVIDGGSSDGTVGLLEQRASELGYWESQPDRGIYHAWNKALVQTRGDWILFLGADDYLWDSTVLARAAEGLKQAEEQGSRVAYGQVAIVNHQDDVLEVIGEPWGNVAAHFLHEMCLPHPGIFHHRQLFIDRGTFDDSYRIAGDYDLLLRELLQATPFYLSDLRVTGMRHGGISSNPANILKQLHELERALRANGLGHASPRLAGRWLRAYMRIIIGRMFGEKTVSWVADCYRVSQGKPKLWTR